MKKYNKLVISLVLGASVVATFGTAYALYTNKVNAKDYTIGIGSVESHTDSTDEVTYKLGTVKAYKADTLADTDAINADTKLSPEVNKVYLKVPLTFEYGKTETTSAQDSVVGRFKVDVTVDEKIAKITDGAKVEAKLVGYQQNGNTDTYFTANKLSNFFTGTFSSEKKTLSGFIDTAVDKTSIYSVITLDFSTAFNDTNYLNVAELTSAFSVSLSWSAYSTSMEDFDTNLIPSAYVRGDKSDWKSLEDYAMVPNINAQYDIVEWQYKLLKGFSKIKVFDANETKLNDNGWIKCKYVDGATKESDGNATLDKTKSYTVYYTRNEDVTDKQGFSVVVDKTSAN